MFQPLTVQAAAVRLAAVVALIALVTGVIAYFPRVSAHLGPWPALTTHVLATAWLVSRVPRIGQRIGLCTLAAFATLTAVLLATIVVENAVGTSPNSWDPVFIAMVTAGMVVILTPVVAALTFGISERTRAIVLGWRKRRHRCSACGHPLDGGLRCPECGVAQGGS